MEKDKKVEMTKTEMVEGEVVYEEKEKEEQIASNGKGGLGNGTEGE